MFCRHSPRSRSGSESPITTNSTRNRTTSESSISSHSISEMDITGVLTSPGSQSQNFSHNALPQSGNNFQNISHNALPSNNMDHDSAHIPSLDRIKQETNLISVESMSTTSVNSEEEFKDAIDAKIPTFFSTMDTRYYFISILVNF